MNPLNKKAITICILSFILLMGILLRASYYAERYHTPAAFVPVQDATYNHYWAEALVTDDWTPPHHFPDPQITNTPYFRPPGYPFFLSTIYRAPTPNIPSAIILQMGLGIINVLLVYLLAKKWADRPTALIAAFLMSTYWMFIMFETLLLDTTLHITLVLLSLLLLTKWLQRPSILMAVPCGCLLGLTCTVRANTLLFIPATITWMMWTMQRNQLTRPHQWACVFAMVFGTVLAIAPVTVRNYRVARDFVPISSNAGLMFNMGNSTDANGLTQIASLNCGITTYRSCFDYASFATNYAAAIGRPMTHSEVSRQLISDTIADIRANPAHTLHLLMRKIILYLGSLESGHNNSIYFSKKYSPLLRHLPGDFALLFSLAATALFIVVKTRPENHALQPACTPPVLEITILLTLFAGTWLLSLIPFVFSSQYRIAVIPVLMVFTAYAVRMLTTGLIRQHYRVVFPALTVFIVVYLLTSHNWTGAVYNRTDWHFRRAYALQQLGMNNAAREQYDRILQLDPANEKAIMASQHLGSEIAQEKPQPAAQPEMGQPPTTPPDSP